MSRGDIAYKISGILIILCAAWIAGTYQTRLAVAGMFIGAVVLILPLGKLIEMIFDRFNFFREGS
jgi:type IV secretory pathway VirB2 component (pilin)